MNFNCSNYTDSNFHYSRYLMSKPNIGRKYYLYGDNIFKNEYMRQLAIKVPHFLKDLRVNLDGDSWSLELQ